MLKCIDHPNVVRLHEIYEDAKQVFLVTELCQGGELFERLMSSPARRFTECEAAVVQQDMLRAIAYLHCINIAHRDVKPENVMLQNRGPLSENVAKLIDFGTACPCSEQHLMRTKVGTSHYVDPQVLDQCYGRECDLWSAGATLYLLLSGSMPFAGRNDAEVLREVQKGRYTLSLPIWSTVSDSAKELIRGLMCRDPRRRLSAELALHSQWVVSTAPSRSVAAGLASAQLTRLRRFGALGPLQKATLKVLAAKLDDVKVKSLREQFVNLDCDADGHITVSDLKHCLAQADNAICSGDLERIVASVASGNSCDINYSEFVAATLDDTTALDHGNCWTAFNVFDVDGDGSITRQELSQTLGVEPRRAEELLGQVDRNGDGTIDFAEFLQFMKGNVLEGVPVN